MAKGNFEACANVTLAYEGGYTNDRRDPGNWTGGKVGVGVLKGTNMGIAANTYPTLDIKNLKRADVLPLYQARYWDGVRGDDLPFGIDLAVYDYGVNSGPSRGIKSLQKALGIAADGKAGPVTVSAAARAADAGPRVIRAICAERLSFLQGLKIWKTFKRGWSARVANVEAKAVAMWLANTGKSAGLVRNILKNEASKIEDVAKVQRQTAGGTVAGGSVSVGAGAFADAAPNFWVVGAVAVVFIALAGVVFLKALRNAERARAYRSAAEA